MRFIYNRFFIVFKWAAKIIIPTDIRTHRNKKSPGWGLEIYLYILLQNHILFNEVKQIIDILELLGGGENSEEFAAGAVFGID